MAEKMFVVGERNADDCSFEYMGNMDSSISVTYDELFSGSDPIASDVLVLNTFPYSFWDQQVEKKDILYGSKDFGQAIRTLGENITAQLNQRFPRARYVNPPMSIVLERDKQKVKDILSSQGVTVPRDIGHTLDEVLAALEEGNIVFAKVRYGSLSKGITCLKPSKWTTNFKYENGVLLNHDGDYDWNEIDVTGDTDFLSRLLEEDVVVEQGISNPLTNGMKFGFRIRYIFGETDPKLAYARVYHGSSVPPILSLKPQPVEALKEFLPEESYNASYELVRKACPLLALQYAGVDILFQGENFTPVILEANSFPSPRSPELVFPKLYKGMRKYL